MKLYVCRHAFPSHLSPTLITFLVSLLLLLLNDLEGRTGAPHYWGLWQTVLHTCTTLRAHALGLALTRKHTVGGGFPVRGLLNWSLFRHCRGQNQSKTLISISNKSQCRDHVQVTRPQPCFDSLHQCDQAGFSKMDCEIRKGGKSVILGSIMAAHTVR